jgi:hypothetical protein
MGKKTRKIPAARLEPESARLEFSFKHLDSTHSKYGLDQCSAEYLRCLIEKIKDYSNYTVDQFRDQNDTDHRYVIDFDKTPAPKGFTSLPSDLYLESPWEFAVCPTATKHSDKAAWRAYGVLIGNVFYFVWLDTTHGLFPNNHPAHSDNKKKK